MNESKPFYKSTGVVGNTAAIVACVVGLAAKLLSLKGVEVSAGDQAVIVSLVMIFGGCIAGLIGRIKANARIGKPLAIGGVFKGGTMLVGEPGPAISRYGRISGPGIADAMDAIKGVASRLEDVMVALQKDAPNGDAEKPDVPREGAVSEASQQARIAFQLIKRIDAVVALLSEKAAQPGGAAGTGAGAPACGSAQSTCTAAPSVAGYAGDPPSSQSCAGDPASSAGQGMGGQAADSSQPQTANP